MIDANSWLDELLSRLRGRFGERLLFLGLQGSYRRGEQTDASDFDAVVILDRLDLSDLAAYRSMLEGLPESEKACGFIGGRDELAAWPRHELFQFVRDTDARFGNLESLVPEALDKDVREAVRIGASGIYHAVCHAFVHAGGADARMEVLRGLFKGAYFVLVQAHFLRTGIYAGTRKSLAEALSGIERRIMEAGNDWEGGKAEREGDPDALFTMLLEWSGSIMLPEAR